MTDPSNRRTAWVLYALTLLSGAPLAAIVAWQTPQPPGACSGIGWGCSLYEWDAAGFMLIFFGIPYVVVLAAVLGVLTLVQRRWAARLTSAVAAVGLLIPWALVAGITLLSGDGGG